MKGSYPKQLIRSLAPHGMFYSINTISLYEDLLGSLFHVFISDSGTYSTHVPSPYCYHHNISLISQYFHLDSVIFYRSLTHFRRGIVPILPDKKLHLPVPKALTLSTATWLQAPGAAPQSRTESPGRRTQSLSSISSNLKALRQR